MADQYGMGGMDESEREHVVTVMERFLTSACAFEGNVGLMDLGLLKKLTEEMWDGIRSLQDIQRRYPGMDLQAVADIGEVGWD